MSDSTVQEKTIIVIGSGFGGMAFVDKFRSPNWRIILLDSQNHHLFQPLLYQVATAGLSATDIAQPVREVFREREDVLVIMEDVVSVDLKNQEITTQLHRIPFDALVLAVGARTGYFGNKEWERLAPGLKTLDDAMRIRREVLYAFERAETCTDPAEKSRLLTTVIVGGGPTGVELAGAFAELAHTVFKKNFRRINPEDARIVLVDSNPRLLKTYPEALSGYALRKLESLGVEVRLGARVTEVGEDFVRIGDEMIPTLNTIWAAGVEAAPLTKTLGVETDRSGRILVANDCSIPDFPNVFVIGDAAKITDINGVEVPGVAQGAIQMGHYVAKLLTSPKRDEFPGFAYYNKGSMATIGRHAAVAEAGNVHMRGTLAWLAWLFVHLVSLVGLRSKFSVLFSWLWNYLLNRKSARIISGLSTRSPRRCQLSDKPQPGFNWK